MNKNLQEVCNSLTNDIQKSYEETSTLEEAEKLAAKFLHAEVLLAQEYKNADLDARMKKSGLKSIKAAVYMEAATAQDKKPSDAFLQNVVDMSALVAKAQSDLDSAEVNLEYVKNYFSIFKEAHIHFRGIAKGRFE